MGDEKFDEVAFEEFTQAVIRDEWREAYGDELDDHINIENIELDEDQIEYYRQLYLNRQ